MSSPTRHEADPTHSFAKYVLASRMAKGITLPKKRQKVTLMVDSTTYRKVRTAVDQMPGISVSDLVSDLLAAVIDELGPRFIEMAQAKNHTERLQMLDKLYADLSGAQALEYARTYARLQAAREQEAEE
jgi:hypothetical protein